MTENIKTRPLEAVNWDVDNSVPQVYWKQNFSQMWSEEEFKPSRDISSWKSLTPEEQTVYVEILAGLTGLDTTQSLQGMPLIQIHYPNKLWEAVFSFMGMMESVHSKSYSHIFTSLLDRKTTHYYLDEWVPNNKYLTVKNTMITNNYRKLLKESPTERELMMAMISSVFLESFLFYSGFYYPLLLSGQGKMIASGEIIRKILIDENIHGSGVGLAFQEIYNKQSEEVKEEVKREMMILFDKLYFNECEYASSIYDKIGLTEDVVKYIQYNGNKALQNLGFDVVFNPEPFNPIVENGLNTQTKNHDFFSVKGDGYILSLNIEDLRDKDFDFNNVQSYELSNKYLS